MTLLKENVWLAAERFSINLRQLIARAARTIPSWLRRPSIKLAISAVVGISFILILLFLAWQTGTPGACGSGNLECDLATAWNASISELGLEPIFPPNEDVYVGDIYVAINKVNGKELSSPNLGRSVKIHHIDLTKEIEAEYKRLPIFPDTAAPPEKEGLPWKQSLTDEGKSVFLPVDQRRSLPIVIFPNLSIHYRSEGESAISLAGQLFGFSHDTSNLETIRIPSAETYGIPTPDANYYLEDFCNKSVNGCTEDRARYILSLVLGSDAAYSTDKCKNFTYDLAIFFINRVYLTRSIILERNYSSSTAALTKVALQIQSEVDQVNKRLATLDSASQVDRATGQVSTNSNLPQSPQEATVVAARRQELEAERDRLEQLLQGASGTEPRASVSVLEGGSRDITLNQTLIRPVAIGFRAVEIEPTSVKEKKKC